MQIFNDLFLCFMDAHKIQQRDNPSLQLNRLNRSLLVLEGLQTFFGKRASRELRFLLSERLKIWNFILNIGLI